MVHTLIFLGFTKCQTDWNFFYRTDGVEKLYIAFHVDYGIIAATSQEVLDSVIENLRTKYDLKVTTRPTSYLKTNFVHTKNTFYLHQKPYIEELALKCKVDDSNAIKTPVEAGFVSGTQANDTPVDKDTTQPLLEAFYM